VARGREIGCRAERLEESLLLGGVRGINFFEDLDPHQGPQRDEAFVLLDLTDEESEIGDDPPEDASE
jgi:hypothetical protein